MIRKNRSEEICKTHFCYHNFAFDAKIVAEVVMTFVCRINRILDEFRYEAVTF